MTTRNTTIKTRTTAVIAGFGALAAVATGAAAGAAHAGTLPAGQSTVAMTLTNHTDRTEYLAGANPGSGHWINAPRRTLAPGASEIVTAAAPHAQTVTVDYRIGAAGPHAIYQLVNTPAGANTNATGTTGGHYFINANLSSGYPHTNVGYDLW
ncbi:hypothetical protein [Gordonia sp. FQ]|uniref:hypothetical protein n=1 Tax=Gordonia sp. FQ TaxID=3446634 RepID=UPI003F84F43A